MSFLSGRQKYRLWYFFWKWVAFPATAAVYFEVIRIEEAHGGFREMYGRWPTLSEVASYLAEQYSGYVLEGSTNYVDMC